MTGGVIECKSSYVDEVEQRWLCMCGGYAKNKCMCRMREVKRDLLNVMHFDISRLCTRPMLILLLIYFLECRNSYNRRLRVFCTQWSMLFCDSVCREQMLCPTFILEQMVVHEIFLCINGFSL